MPYRFGVGIGKIKKSAKSMSFQRLALMFLCLVMIFAVAMPNQVMAWSLLGQKPQPSVLDAQKLDTTKAQAANAPTKDTSMSEKKDRRIDREDTSKRTARSSTYVNKDGTKTFEYSVRQKNYRNGSKWEKIDNRLSPVEEKTSDPTFWQAVTNTAPESKPAEEFTGKAGLMGVRMMPLSKGITMSVGGKTVTMKPVGSAGVKPEKKNDTTTIYKNAWKGVDLEYQTEGELVKENIVIKQKDVATEYEFKLTGGKLIDDPKNPGYFTVEGAQDGYRFGGLTLALHDRGPIQIPERSIKQEKTNNNSIKVSLDKSWLKSLPASSFPMVIDPSFGRWDADPTDWMFKSDGYSCQGNSCWIQAGTLNDNGWKHWRSYVHIPYPELAGKKVLGANIHAYYNPYANPDPNPRYLFFGHANCIGWDCRGKHLATVLTAGDFDVNVTDELQLAVNGGNMGATWSFWGEEVPYKTFKTYSDMHLSVVYDTPTPIATPTEPADKQVTVSTQPTLRVNGVGDADGDAVRYYYRVSTSPDAETGAVINSGWTSATQWTIPDGILQDGTTYYWHTYTQGATQTNPNWVRSFKVDLRTGKDSTQAYDTVGPVGIDLATGNATTSTSTHTMSALGGTVGLNFDYNTPTKSKTGLIGEYWNVSSSHNFGAGPPSGTPNLKSHDQDINFSWPNGSSPGPGVNSDWFYARWKGYFVAPTTGSYQFGASQDDAVDINVNGQSFSGCYGSTPCYYGTPITLQAGQVVPITVSYEEATGDGYFRMYVKGAVSERIVPRDWLRTEVQPSVAQYGLTGRYYTDDGSHNFPANNDDPMRFMMARNDSKLSFNWGTNGPAPGLQTDSFMAKWTGYITVPASGSYTFGATNDDGVRVKLNNGMFGAEQTVLNSWQYTGGTPIWGTATNLTAGQQVPITVEYYEASGPAYITLKVRDPHGVEQEIPVKWLTPKATALPDAWRLGVDVDGNVGYERLRVAGQNIVLEDSTRATHEYTWTGSGYKPPVNEDGQLTRNPNNTYTLLDTDGRTYVFDAEGKLTSLTLPTDDRNPASLKYEYSGDPSRLMKISDGVTNSRYGTLHYKGVNEDGNCSVPGGFDNAPDGMLCAFKTSDGDVTKLYYKAGQLSRIEKPGSELTDYGYDSLGRITSTRDSIANDTISASVRSDDSTLLTEVTYDELGRAKAIKAPAPTSNASRVNHTFEYLTSATQMHIVGAPEPNGFSKRVEYDSLLRTVKETDVANLTAQTEWDSVKDLELSKTDATGLKSTTIYNKNDLPTESYGPAPAAWYGADRKPLTAHTNAIPKTATGYDEGMTGPAVSWYNYRAKPNTSTAAGTGGSLVGAPRLYATGINANTGLLSTDIASPPMAYDPAYTGLGFRMTGKLYLPNGKYWINAQNTEGIRVWIDDELILDSWQDAANRGITGGSFTVANGDLKRFRVDTYRKNGSTGAFGLSIKQDAGFNWTNDWSQWLKPDYALKTSETAYDSQLGNVTTATTYNKPEYGLVDKTTLDPTGLNLQTNSTYETPGASGSFLRQTSKTLPGGGTTNYQHYSATDTRDNPCTPETETYHQGGRTKGKVEADPDGAGPLTPRTSETIYNASGEAIATRYNDDAWTCTAYDARGRVQQTTIPSLGNKPGRTITNDYAKDGNPLITTTTDNSGTIRVENDLLGRTVKYVDAKGKVTENTYDNYGKLTSRTSPIGTESYEYDNYDRLTVQKLDGVTQATIAYDQFSRVANVQYPAGISLSSIGRDGLGRENATTYTLNPSASTVSATQTLRQGGDTATIASAGGANHDGTPHSPTTFTLPNLNGTYDATKSLQFRLPIDAGSGVGNATQTRVSYDFSGDGTWDRQETYGYFATDPVTGYENYTQSVGLQSSSGGFAQLQNGTVKVEVWNAIGNSPTTLATSQTAGPMQATVTLPYTMSGGSTSPQTITETIERYVSGDIKQGTENGTAKSYTYDNAGRLTGATIGSNTFAYEFGAPDPACSGTPGYNPNAAKNGNRTKLTMNGQVTTYCYDMADRLTASSDPHLTNAQYDSHGNTTSLGHTAHKTEFGYDASDRNTSLKSGNKETLFTRDVQDRIIGREHKENGSTTSGVAYGFTGSGDTPDFLLDGNGDVTQKYVTLPGDVIITIKPGDIGASARTYSLPNIHGDVMATINADGTPISTHVTGPFGEALPNQTNPQNTAPGTSWNYVGQHQKLTDTDTPPIPGGIIQMGARVYIPTLGRFFSVDPIEGAGDNAYSYVNDPVNEEDLDGKIPPLIAFAAWQLGRLAVQQTIKIAAQHAAKQAAQQVVKKAVVRSTKKVTQAAVKQTAMPIKGYTRHGLNQAISRNNHGVSVRAINNAVRRPVSIIKQSNNRTRYNGRDAVVVLNKQGKVITTWAKNKNGRRY